MSKSLAIYDGTSKPERYLRLVEHDLGRGVDVVVVDSQGEIQTYLLRLDPDRGLIRYSSVKDCGLPLDCSRLALAA